MVPPSESLDRCPHKAEWVLLNVESGQVLPASCKRNGCEYCGPRKASGVGGAITLAEPERLITLTQVGPDWATIRGRVKRLSSFIRRETGKRFQMAYHVEPNPKGTGHHVHGFQRGDFIPQAVLASMASRQGMGYVVDIRRYRAGKRASTYGVKLAGIGYGLKATATSEGLRSYLDLNGGRFVHASRDFWRDENGQRCTQGDAVRAWWRTRHEIDEESGQWQLVRRTDLSRAVGAHTSTR